MAIFEVSNVPNFNKFRTLDIGTNLGLAGGKHSIKIIFEIKIEIRIFEISNVPNFSTIWAKW